jgi:sulfide:quinone oxidoreductase
MPPKTVLILGGGTGGLVAANRLRRLLPKEHRIVLVDRTYVYSFPPSYTRVMLNLTTGRRISRDLRWLEKKGIEFKQATVTRIDPANKRVLLDNGQVTYDYLLIALGAQYSAEEVEGLGRTWTYYHLEGAEGLQEHLPTFEGGRIVFCAGALPYKCPPAFYEGALLLDDYFRRRKLRDRIEISVVSPELLPLPEAGDEIGQRIAQILSERDIAFSGGKQLSSVDHEHKLLHFADSLPADERGSDAPWDMVIATPVHRVPDVLVQSGFAEAGGWVPANPETLCTHFEDVYAIGDCTVVPIGDGGALPKAGVFAHGEAEVVSRNIAAEIEGADPIWAYGGQGACFMETGGGKGAYISTDFFAQPPHFQMRGPSRFRHWSKLGFERLWLWRWF